jgi:hypothetical protein
MTSPSLESNPCLPLIIDRRDVMSDRIDASFRILSRCIESSDSVRRYGGTLELSIEGYSDDPRQAHEIPEVRRFIQSLHERFPYWIHFSSKSSPGLASIQLCLLENICTVYKGDTFQTEQVLHDLRALLMEQLSAVEQLYTRFGLTAHEYQQLTSQLSEYMQSCAELF